ncbi:biotin transporter BioY [Glaciecola sp. SC05]|uniref:biotin transporter BioY n=1 Tax=Glaciecola sp. SC05 TaxID=1987355 RepID=UPI0035289726
MQNKSNTSQQSQTISSSSLLITAGAAVIALSAQLPLQVPLLDTDIPGTWQTFAVLVFAYANRPVVAILAVVLYLLLGILGLPVFAEGSSGFSVLIGNTGGYLYGFVIGAGLISYIGRQYPQRGIFNAIIAMTVGTITILLFGVVHLSVSIGINQALTYGLYPFVLGALIKIVLGAAVFPVFYSIKTLVNRF